MNQSDSLAIKQLKSPNECSLYAYETEISSGSVVNKNAASTASGTDSHRPKPEAVEVTPMMEKEEEVEEGLPAKMLRCDTATPEPMECDDSSNTAQDLGGGSGGGGGEPGKAVVMEWHSCAICLEEMVDEELLTHASCGAVLCSTCLHAAQQHGGGGGQGDTSGTGSFSCPVGIDSIRLERVVWWGNVLHALHYVYHTVCAELTLPLPSCLSLSFLSFIANFCIYM